MQFPRPLGPRLSSFWPWPGVPPTDPRGPGKGLGEELWGAGRGRGVSPGPQGPRVAPQQADGALGGLGPGGAVLCVLLAAPPQIRMSPGVGGGDCEVRGTRLPDRPPPCAPPQRGELPARRRSRRAHLRFPTRLWSSRCSRALSRRRLSSLVNVPSECRKALWSGWRGGGRVRAGRGRTRGARVGGSGAAHLRGAGRGAQPRSSGVSNSISSRARGAMVGAPGVLSSAAAARAPRGPYSGAPGGGRAGGVSTAPAPRSPGSAPSIRGKVRAAPPSVVRAGRPPPCPADLAPQGGPGRAGAGAGGGGGGGNRLCQAWEPPRWARGGGPGWTAAEAPRGRGWCRGGPRRRRPKTGRRRAAGGSWVPGA